MAENVTHTLHWVQGNTVHFAIPLQQEIQTPNGKVVQDYYPSTDDIVNVFMCGKYLSTQIDCTVNGNVVIANDNGNLKTGVYGVEIRIAKANGTNLRSMWNYQVEIHKTNDGVLTEWNDFVAPDSQSLDAAIFFFVKGEKGDKGDAGTAASISVGTVTKGNTASVTNSGTTSAAVFNFVLPKGEDGVGIVSITYKDTDAQGGNVYTVLLDNGHSYDITCPKGDASTADINLNGSIISVTNNEGVTKTIDVLSSTDERVQITVTTDVPGVSVAGLTINAYYNNASVPTATCTTDANGMAVLSVPNGYKYRLVFPTIQGCKPIADVVHTASVSQRSVEVEYEEYVISDGEIVRVVVEQKTGDVLSRVAGVDIVVTYDGTATTYTTDATGTVQFIVPYGKQYTITAPHREDWYLHENRYTLNLTAEQTNRAVTFVYRSYESGLAIIAADGGEYTLEEWEAAVEAGTRQNSEAMLIKISTGQLAQNGGVFAIDIDMVRGRTQGSNRAWSSQNVQFNSIPLNGNSTSAAYYYDGLTASRLVQQEGDERSIDTLAVDQCLAMSRVIGAGTGAELSLPGFLGSVGQWNELWKNVVEIDDILLSTRPEGQYLMSTWTTSKWTITQNNANHAWYWGTAAGYNGKNNSYVVLPFFAY